MMRQANVNFFFGEQKQQSLKTFQWKNKEKKNYGYLYNRKVTTTTTARNNDKFLLMNKNKRKDNETQQNYICNCKWVFICQWIIRLDMNACMYASYTYAQKHQQQVVLPNLWYINSSRLLKECFLFIRKYVVSRW